MGINDLLQKIEAEKGFAEKYQSLESTDAFLAQAKKDGYSVTEEEVIASYGLSDEVLEGANGGSMPLYPKITPKDA